MDLKKIMKASTLIVVIGVVLVLFSVVLDLVPNFISGDITGMIDQIRTIIALALFPAFFALYLLSGIRGVRKFQFDPIGAGYSTAFAYVLVAIFHLLINMLINMLSVNSIVSVPTYRSSESVLAGSLLGGVSGITGVLLSFVCGLGMILAGALMNFVVGAAGGVFASGRKAN